MLFVILANALCGIFVNISLELDNEKAILKELKLLNNYLKEEKELPAYKPIIIEEVTEEESVVEMDIPKEHYEVDYELEKEVYEKIVEGKDMDARILLIQKKGMSIPAAINFIQTIKNSLQ